MKQRVALARALAPNPQVLLMDEPFAALDAMTREHLYADLQNIQQKRRKTVVFVTHDQDEALGFYIGKLGFPVHTDVKNGDYRWLTVTCPDQGDFQLGLFAPQPPTLDSMPTGCPFWPRDRRRRSSSSTKRNRRSISS